MKLDVNVLRYLSKDEFRVLTAVEMGQKNHEIVPLPLIDNISGLKHGGAFKCVKILLRHKLLHHDNSKYDGYRLTNMGYDFLALKTLVNRGHISSVGRQIGVGKESDIWEVMNEDGDVMALKLHRLGRTSFRAVKSKRDYLGKRHSFSWLYLSRLAALKEYAFMRALGDHGFCVPTAIDHNRHAVLMSLVDAHPLAQVKELGHPARVYQSCMDMISQLAGKGLIHCDFNEFNLLVKEDETVVLIDFPQMVSTLHPNAEELFERDVECVHRFFTKKIGYIPEMEEYERPVFTVVAYLGAHGLDAELQASGFSRKQQQQLEEAQEAHKAQEDDGVADGEEDEDEVEDEGEDGHGDEEDEEEGNVLQDGATALQDRAGLLGGKEERQAESGRADLHDEEDLSSSTWVRDSTLPDLEPSSTSSSRNHVKGIEGSHRVEQHGQQPGAETAKRSATGQISNGNGELMDGCDNEESVSGRAGSLQGEGGMRPGHVLQHAEVEASRSEPVEPVFGSEVGVSFASWASSDVAGNGSQVLLARQRIVAERRQAARPNMGAKNTNKAKNRGARVGTSNSGF